MEFSFPTSPDRLIKLTWADFKPFYEDLRARSLDSSQVEAWLSDWSRLDETLLELYNRLYVMMSANTTDQEIKELYYHFLDSIYPLSEEAEQHLKEKLLASGLEPEGFAIPLRNMRTQAELFRPANLPLETEEQKLNSEYDQVTGAQTVEWETRELTISQINPVLKDPDRATRERAWRLMANRQLADRQSLNGLWQKLLALRLKMAENAGEPDYRAFHWKQLQRYDYTPEDCEGFHRAIEAVVAPAASRIYARRQERLGVDPLRPWDLTVDPLNQVRLKPYEHIDELKSKTASIFRQVDPLFGKYFQTMVAENLLDLDNRKNKAPGGFCTSFPVAKRPFIFMNAVGLHDDVQTLLHESGHSFHNFEASRWPYIQQRRAAMEFAEVASMGMELLASPYLAKSKGGFYSEKDAARARIEHLESCILFWPYMAVVDAFQHWVYTRPAEAADPNQCDATWTALWNRFMPGVDYSGLEDVLATGWQRKLHIFTVPFYYIEYGLAQLGAAQVWRNALSNQAGAVARYRYALTLGGTVTLPELYKAAGVRLAFDAETFQEIVALMENTISQLEEV
jgi:oligoendopeptidase F